MLASVLRLRQTHIFYGWWIVAAAALGWALNAGIYFYGFGAFFLSLQAAFQVNRATLAGAISLARLETGLLGPLEGYLVDRLGPRKVMLFGITLMGTGFILLSQVQNIYQFYLVFVPCAALGASLGFTQPLAATIANWFIRRRGTAIGIATSGVGLGGLVVPLLAWIIATYGWRAAMVAAGVTIWSIGLPIALMMRHRPEQYGYLPDGGAAEATTQRRLRPRETDFTARQALRTSTFWLLSFSFALRIMVSSSMVIHLVPFMEDSGIPTGFAAMALGSLAITSVVGRIGIGWLGDWFDRKRVMLVGLVIMAASLFIVAVGTELWYIVLFFVLYAPCYGGLASGMHALRGDYFGRTSYATIAGYMAPIQAMGTIIGPVLAGLIYDVTDSYRLAFVAFGISCLLSLALLSIARRPTLRAAQASSYSAMPAENL